MNNYNYIIICAAISDYIPTKYEGKISSDNEKLNLELKKAPKIISQIRKQAPKSKIIAFKLEKDKGQIIQKSLDLLTKNQLDFVIANTTKGFNSDENEIWIINKKGKTIHKKGKKEDLSNSIIDHIK